MGFWDVCFNFLRQQSFPTSPKSLKFTPLQLTRIGFGGVLYHNYNKEPAKPYSNCRGSYSYIKPKLPKREESSDRLRPGANKLFVTSSLRERFRVHGLRFRV